MVLTMSDYENEKTRWFKKAGNSSQPLSPQNDATRPQLPIPADIGRPAVSPRPEPLREGPSDGPAQIVRYGDKRIQRYHVDEWQPDSPYVNTQNTGEPR